MYVGTVTESTISLMNDFMESQEEYLLIKDIFHVYSHNREDHFALMLGRMNEYEKNRPPKPSTVIISDFKKAIGKNIYLTDIEKKLKMDILTPTNISLPMYILLRKCVSFIQEKAVYPDDYETLIKFDFPIEINAKCDRRSSSPDPRYYNEGPHFPLVNSMAIKDYLIAHPDKFEIFIYYIGKITNLLINLLNLDLIIFTGKFKEIADYMWPLLYKQINSNKLSYIANACEFKSSNLGATSPAIGVAICAYYDKINEDVNWNF